jgi:hypothetical protein
MKVAIDVTVDAVAELPRSSGRNGDDSSLAGACLERRETRKSVDSELMRERISVFDSHLRPSSCRERGRLERPATKAKGATNRWSGELPGKHCEHVVVVARVALFGKRAVPHPPIVVFLIGFGTRVFAGARLDRSLDRLG